MNHDAVMTIMAVALPPGVPSVRAARRGLVSALDPLVARGDAAETAVDTAALLVSELVANSVQHAGLAADQPIEVAARVTRNGVLRVTVLDHGRGFTPGPVEMPPPTAPDGRGLAMVDRLAARWGTARGRRMCVWFDLPLHGPLA